MAINIQGFKVNRMAAMEAEGLANCFQAYAENTAIENIEEIGFNENTGYIYIALENGVSIASAFGNEVEYIVTDFETGEEYFCETYDEALDQLENF